jgi:hypothetical protein
VRRFGFAKEVAIAPECRYTLGCVLIFIAQTASVKGYCEMNVQIDHTHGDERVAIFTTSLNQYQYNSDNLPTKRKQWLSL